MMNKLSRIPNRRWLAIGVVLTAALMFTQRDMPWWVHVSTLAGTVVACWFLALSNPEDQEGRIDIAICVPLVAVMWPIFLLAMVVSKPWNDPKWKNRGKGRVRSEEQKEVDDIKRPD